MDKKIYQKVQRFGITQQKIKNLEDILEDEKNSLKSQGRQMYKSVYAKLNIFFRNSRTPFAKMMRHGEITKGAVIEDFCGRSPVKNLSWRLSQFLLGIETSFNKINTNSIEDFTITQKEIDELNELLSEKLEVRFSLLNDSYFMIMKK